MSKGNPIVPLRFPPQLLDQVDAKIRRSLDTRAAEPWTRTSFILAAVKEKLAKMKRSAGGRRKGRTAGGPADGL